ncbi:hypothetical protein CGC20_5565 [Leishmania donovani]|uniref:Uncharacterized protein n=1 Tax=Leishmania donovani TaxID=5661 RepID=A0A504XTX8_LEIDO|nr:hypothetical protein CGC20_5565 [Leishmania donovani]
MRGRTLTLLVRDALNAGSSMTLGSKGMRPSPEAHRRRMPWTAAKEYVPGVVLNSKEKLVLDGTQLVELDHIDRASQVDPLEVLKAAVATRAYNTSTGLNIFQLASQTRFHGRGQKFFREEWRQGTYEKYVTLAAIDFDREGSKGTAYGYITFHGESTTRPVEIHYADTPDPSTYRLKAYPFYDAPNPPEFVERLLKDRGVLPDLPMDASAPAENAAAASADGARADGSHHYEPRGSV